jgi:biotin carboxylase
VGDRDALAGALAGLPTQGYGWLAEARIEGVEMSVESFVRDGAVVFANPTEYIVQRHANLLPAPLTPAELEPVLELNRRALAAAGVVRGITHLELFRTADGPVFGELAARPPGGRLMPLLRRAWGFDPWEAALRLELDEPFAFPERPRRVAGVWILHPGAGTVAGVEGIDAARAVGHVDKVTVRVRPGDRVEEREGSGQDIGAIRASGPDRDTVAEALRRAEACLRIALA